MDKKKEVTVTRIRSEQDCIRPILERLIAADNLSEPLSALKKALQGDLTTEEIDQGIKWLHEKGVILKNSYNVSLCRASIRAALLAELGLGSS